MVTTYKKILAYAGAEAFAYQSLLMLHQIALYATIERQLYGLIGTAFSLVYLGVVFVNFGFDQAVAVQFHAICQNRVQFKDLVLHQIGLNALLSCLALIIAYCIWSSSYQAIFNTQDQLIIIGCIFIETYKKSTKNILYLMLRHRFTAFSELVHIVSYIGIVWLLLYTGMQASIPLFFIPLLVVSLPQTIVHIAHILCFYYTLPITSAHHEISRNQHMHNRFAHYLYQLSHSIYSPNFLVPLFAHTHGMELAGILKFVSMIAYSINSLIRHTFGAACTGIFSAIRRSSLADKQRAFAFIDLYLIKTGMALLCLLAAIGCYIYFCAMANYSGVITISGFLFLIFSEHLIITHEQFMVVEGKIWQLCMRSIIAFIPLLLIHTTGAVSVMHIVLALLAAKYLSYLLIMYYTQSSWQLFDLNIRSKKEVA